MRVSINLQTLSRCQARILPGYSRPSLEQPLLAPSPSGAQEIRKLTVELNLFLQVSLVYMFVVVVLFTLWCQVICAMTLYVILAM